MTTADWQTANVKKGLMEEVERLLKLEVVRREGITNMSQFVDAALKEKIAKMETKRFDHVNMHEDHVKILDNNLEKHGRIVSVYFRDEQAWCDYCEEHFCVHIQYAWEIPEVRRVLENSRMTPPPSRTP